MVNFLIPQVLVGAMQMPGTIEQHREWGERAFERLKKDALPPSPENYALFFCYFAQRIPDLNMSIDELTKQFGVVTQEQCNHLYTAHLGVEAEKHWLEHANTALEAEMRKILELLGVANQGTDRFGKTLDSFAGQLNKVPALDSLKTIVDRVTQETRVITEQNTRLQTQLSQSTQQMSELRYNLDKVRQESLIDPLTEVGNRKFFQNGIERLIAEAMEAMMPLSLLMIDIDHFKQFNDTHGHLVGDQVLKLVGKTLLESIKGRDMVARYGGEEFAVLLPQTPLDVGTLVGDQLRNLVGTKQITRRSTGESLGVITMSIGVAEYRSGESALQLIERADRNLYKAKQEGRNRVVAWEGE
ncbi:MAG: GGDEF domain-containing protein [Alphaproteobacteria bacterium]